MTYVPYPQQLAIQQHFATDPSSLIVEACAGSGKTTTVLESVLASTDATTLICAFNTRIKEAMEEKLSQRRIPAQRLVEVRTFHSLGLKLLGQHWHGAKIDKKATDEAVRQCFSGNARARYHVARLVAHCKDVDPRLHEHPDAVERAKRVVMAEVNDLKLLDQPAVVYQMAQAIVDVMVAGLRRRERVDFADMVWVPVACNLAPRGRYKRIVVDEAQDMSLAQFELIERFVAPGGGIVMVGDLHQEIYQFRGADGSKIWDRMRTRWHAKTLPLTVSFRCARAVIAEAQDIVEEIEPRRDAVQGVVDEIDAEELLAHAKPGDFVLSRANAPLVSLAIDAWLRGAKPVIEGGREMGEPLFQILDKLSITSKASYENSLNLWYREQVARSTSDASSAWTDRIDDWHALLMGVGQRVGPQRVREVLKTIFAFEQEAAKEGFSIDLTDDAPSLKYLSFSTVHKAKGLEADRVFLLKQSFWRHQERESEREPPQEELNIEYVGITRAKRHLTWVNIDDGRPKTKGSPLSNAGFTARREAFSHAIDAIGDKHAPEYDEDEEPAAGDPEDAYLEESARQEGPWDGVGLPHPAQVGARFTSARDLDTGVLIEGSVDEVLEAAMGGHLDAIGLKHHGAIPNRDRSFMRMPKPSVTVTVPDPPAPRFNNLTRPHSTTTASGRQDTCQACGADLTKYSGMDACPGPTKPEPAPPPRRRSHANVVVTVGNDPVVPRRTFPPSAPKAAPRRVFPPAIKRPR